MCPRPWRTGRVLMAAALRGLRGRTLWVPARLMSSPTSRAVAASPRLMSSPTAPAVAVSPRPMSSLTAPAVAAPRGFETLRLQREREHVLHVELHRPEKRNALNSTCWREIRECFQELAEDPSCRAIVISGAGKVFTAGIDLVEMGGEFMAVPGEDTARRAWNLRRKICQYQETFSALEKCPKPVIAAIHGACVGAGVDLISACDIRYCTQDAWFQVKEVDIGLAADVGTLQRLPRIVGSQSLVNELALTARKMMAPEAQSCGLVSRVFPDKAALLEGALEVAVAIAARSPVAVQGTKVQLVYARDHPVAEGLRYVATWNMAMLQTDDIPKAAQATLEKKGPEDVPFARL